MKTAKINGINFMKETRDPPTFVNNKTFREWRQQKSMASMVVGGVSFSVAVGWCDNGRVRLPIGADIYSISIHPYRDYLNFMKETRDPPTCVNNKTFREWRQEKSMASMVIGGCRSQWQWADVIMGEYGCLSGQISTVFPFTRPKDFL